MIDSRQNTEVNDEAIKGFKTESLSKLLLTHCRHKLELKIASKIFCHGCTKMEHTDHPFGGFLFLVLVNVTAAFIYIYIITAAYLYHTGNKKRLSGFCTTYGLG